MREGPDLVRGFFLAFLQLELLTELCHSKTLGQHPFLLITVGYQKAIGMVEVDKMDFGTLAIRKIFEQGHTFHYKRMGNFCNVSGVDLPHMITSELLDKNALLIPLPTPREPPVTKTTLSLSLIWSCMDISPESFSALACTRSCSNLVFRGS